MKLFGFNCAGDVVLKFDDGEDEPDFETDPSALDGTMIDQRTKSICDDLAMPMPLPLLPFSIVNHFIHNEQNCPNCRGTGHVCEDHPTALWMDGEGCCGAAGMPCPRKPD